MRYDCRSLARRFCRAQPRNGDRISLPPYGHAVSAYCRLCHRISCQPVYEADRGKAIALIKDIATENDVVVIAGKGHEDYQILADKTIHFDDREEARKVFETANV